MHHDVLEACQRKNVKQDDTQKQFSYFYYRSSLTVQQEDGEVWTNGVKVEPIMMTSEDAPIQ